MIGDQGHSPYSPYSPPSDLELCAPHLVVGLIWGHPAVKEQVRNGELPHDPNVCFLGKFNTFSSHNHITENMTGLDDSNSNEPVPKRPKIQLPALSGRLGGLPKSTRKKAVEACQNCREKRIKVCCQHLNPNKYHPHYGWELTACSATENGLAKVAAGRATSAV